MASVLLLFEKRDENQSIFFRVWVSALSGISLQHNRIFTLWLSDASGEQPRSPVPRRCNTTGESAVTGSW